MTEPKKGEDFPSTSNRAASGTVESSALLPSTATKECVVAAKSVPTDGIETAGPGPAQEADVSESTFLSKSLSKIAGTEEKRFAVGSVLVPLVIAIITITIGARIVSNYQDWQDRRSRIRDVIGSIRSAATALTEDLEILAQKGGAVERIWTNQSVLDEVRAVEGSLAQIQGMNRVLAQDADLRKVTSNHTALPAQISKCKQAVDSYVDCLSKTLSNPARSEGTQVCTTTFREGLAADGSCKSLEVTAYSIVY